MPTNASQTQIVINFDLGPLFSFISQNKWGIIFIFLAIIAFSQIETIVSLIALFHAKLKNKISGDSNSIHSSILHNEYINKNHIGIDKEIEADYTMVDDEENACKCQDSRI